MKLFVQIKPNAKQSRITKIDDTHYEVRVKEPAKDGKANLALINLLAKELNIPKIRIKIIKGQKSKLKMLEIK